MSETPLHDLSIAAAGRKLRDGSLTSMALTQDALVRIARIDPAINAFITVTKDRALADAQAADAAFARGEDKGPLQGIPYALKDIYDTAGVRTTCHSKLRVDHVPSHDSAVEEKLHAQGGVLLGKLATHEFALGGPSFDLPFPPARNPWNTEHATGGSSSGSGAAVAAGLVRMAMGTDTGGSIRGPAALCGTIGIKPTFGRVSRRGIFPLAYSLDHAGPLAWSVEDAAITLNAIAGFDPSDQGSAQTSVPDFCATLDHGVKGLRIGVPRHFFEKAAGVSPEVIKALDAAAQTLAQLGAIVEDVRLPDYELFAACGRVIMFTEAFAIHQKDFQERPLDFALSTYSRMVMGAFVTGPDLVQAHRLRRELTHAVTNTLHRYDALLTACTIAPAPLIKASRDRVSDSPTQSMPFNVTGHPALSIPVGFSSDGLPLSMQIAGRHFDEATILRIAAAFEAQSGLNKKRPALAT
jgi:aspartyl-tRNA(Asn)/glutamyl-tRNA(Gln) amidotransferase subunit A